MKICMFLIPIMAFNRFRKYLANKFGININDEQTNPTALSSLDVDGIVGQLTRSGPLALIFS